MVDHVERLSLLEEIDARQDELLDSLDQLNARIEQLLAQCGGRPDPAASRAEG